MSFIQLKGGLDFVSPPTNINPGSLFDCYNFEVALTDGYRRIDGLQRFDGRPVPESIKLYTLRAEYDDSETPANAVSPLYHENSQNPSYNNFTWTPETFPNLTPGQAVYFQRAKSVTAENGLLVTWSSPIKGYVSEPPSFIEGSGNSRTGLIFFPAGRFISGEILPNIAQNLYFREAVSDKPKGSTLSGPVPIAPSQPSGVAEWPPGQKFGIYNNLPVSTDIDITDAEIPWDKFKELSDTSAQIHRQTVKEFPGGHALGMEWVDDKLYAVAETQRFSYTDLDDAVLALFERRQWCYYNPTYQLTTDGPLGVTNNRSQIEVHGATIYQDAHCLSVDGEIELLIPQFDPLRSGEDTEPVGLDIYLLTELKIKNILKVPSPGDTVTTSGGYQATVRGVYLGEDGATGIALVETSSGSVSVDDIILESGDEQFTVSGVFGGSSLGNPLCELSEADMTGNDAVLVKSTHSSGFLPVDMGYELRFKNGAVEPLTVYQKPDAEAETGDTGNVTGDEAKNSKSGFQWSSSTGVLDPETIESNDSDYAKSTIGHIDGQSKWLVVSDLGMTVNNLDSITGLEVTIVAEKASGTGDLVIERVGYYTPEDNRVWSKTFHEPVDTKDTFTFGGANDSFVSGTAGQPSLSPNLVNNPGFGVAIRCKATGGGTYPLEARIYQVQVKIHYLTGSTQVWLHDGSTDLASAHLMHKHLEAGAWSDGDAEGVLSMRGDVVDMTPGTEIRTQPSGGGALIAKVASGPDPSRLPGLGALDRNASQYLFMTTNFFAAEHLRATYGVSGAGPAFCFNDDYFFFIRTGVEEDKAKPRHLSRFRDRLVLAYKNGNLDVSSPGEPAIFDAVTEGAATLGVGERVTGLLTLQGESMAVFTENQIIAWQGADNDTFQSNIISPSSGAIEYTVADMGMPVFCDFRGIGTISTSEKYGDFERGRLSSMVTPWLAPRLQGASRGTDDDISVAGVLLVRNKNQYRVIFRDGKVLTMTMRDGPEFTIQEYLVKRPGRYADAKGEELDPIPDEWQFSDERIDLISACWGVTEDGQDRVFISSRGYPYLLEVDRGVTFDGQTISASFTANMGSAGDSGQNKRLNVLHFYGQVRGFATLDHQVGMDYALPDGKPVRFRIGDESDDYYQGSRPAFTKTRTSARGRDVFLKVSHESGTEHPFTLQAYRWPDASPRRMER